MSNIKWIKPRAGCGHATTADAYVRFSPNKAHGKDRMRVVIYEKAMKDLGVKIRDRVIIGISDGMVVLKKDDSGFMLVGSGAKSTEFSVPNDTWDLKRGRVPKKKCAIIDGKMIISTEGLAT